MTDDPHYWAKRAFDRQDERTEKQFEAAVDSATNALKAALLLNGGACIALLAFLSSTYGIEHLDTDRARLIGTIANSLKWFALGAAASVLANTCGYLANRFFAESASSYRKTFDYPYIRPTRTSKAWNVSAIIFNVVGAIIGLSSIGLFLCGLTKISAVF